MDNTNYDSKHTGPEIDAAIDRAKAGGEIDKLLYGKAPDGFGLGGASVSFSDANDCVKNGFYRDGSGTALNTPFSWCHLLVTNFGVDYVRQDAFATGGNGGVSDVRHAVRIKHPNLGGWGQWEWESGIPMQLGVEYRTTERYNDKPVYAKALSMGNMPAVSTTKSVTFGTGTEIAIDVTGRMEHNSDTYTIPFDIGNGTYAKIYAHGPQVFLLNGEQSLSAYNVFATVKYIKTTD